MSWESARPARLATFAAALFATAAVAAPASADLPLPFETRSLDGRGNNLFHPSWGQAGTRYSRVARANYGDGKSSLVTGVPPRYTSNRVFNDKAQNLFSENNVSQWGWTWGQFMDHTFGLAQGGGEPAPIGFNAGDPLEDFQNDFGSISFTRDAAAPGTGTNIFNPRQHINTLSSYIDAFNVYGGDEARLEWLRQGPVDGDMSNNGAHLIMTANDLLPRATFRGDAATAPNMAVDGQLAAHPDTRVIAGDVRGNENMALTSVHTLFAREHNRIVDLLAGSGLGAERKFQVARRIVGAEEQYVTYNEFLPAMGVNLPPYGGYRPDVDATLSTEFATVGYRAHSQIHGEFEIEAEAADYTDTQLNKLRAMGVAVTVTGTDVAFVVPLSVAFFNPDLVKLIGPGPVLQGLTGEPQYKNDEQIDNALRSILFQVPATTPPNPECFEDPTAEGCFHGVVDLGAIDIQRGRDHGVPNYNALRMAYGLAPKDGYKALTGEDTADPIDINDPSILDFTALFDKDGNSMPLEPRPEAGAVVGIRRTTLASRLKAIYGAGNVDKVDAFVGAYSEPHVAGSEMGQLNRAIWRKQFAALRDGDRFFYANDPVLAVIEARYGITYRHTLAELIAMNTDVPQADLPANVFEAP